MAEIVLRVRLVDGAQLDVVCGDPDRSATELIEHAISVLSEDSGVLYAEHGGRTLVLYGRGVATVEVAPRGPVI